MHHDCRPTRSSEVAKMRQDMVNIQATQGTECCRSLLLYLPFVYKCAIFPRRGLLINKQTINLNFPALFQHVSLYRLLFSERHVNEVDSAQSLYVEAAPGEDEDDRARLEGLRPNTEYQVGKNKQYV